MVFVAIILIILLTVWLIKKKNTFVVLASEVQRCMSEVNTAKAKYLSVQKKAIGLAGKATNNEGEVYNKVQKGRGHISTDMLLSLGQMYPDLKDKFEKAADLSERLYEDYRDAQSSLNSAITDYNNAINMFPSSIAAYLFGYEQEELIDQKNLKKSKILKMEEELNLEDWF